MRWRAATHALACGALFACLPGCADPAYVSLGGNLATPFVAADAGVPPATRATTDDEPACPAPPGSGALELDNPCPQPTVTAGSCELSAAAVVLPDNCAERQQVPCAELAGYSPPASADARLDATFEALLLGCSERINVLKVQLEGGCVVRFELENPRPGVSECVAARLESERYACATDLSCGRGDIYQVPTI